jgi:nicotinate-nucleotide adenylyltransferase
MKKVVLFGGSFDPIHFGHIKIAKIALKQRKADQVWFVLSLQSPLKQKTQTAFEHRAHMIELMIKGDSRFNLSRVEAMLGEPSYTIQTIQYLKSVYPNITFEWLIGSDQAQQFKSWKSYDTLLKEASFIVYRRSLEDTIPTEMISLDHRQLFPESSQSIRQGICHYTHPKVIEYAMQHTLYLDEMIQHSISKKRYLHVISVAKLAQELAHAHQLDLKKVHLAAMLHDIVKEWPYDKLERWLSFVDPSYLEQPKEFWHQKVGAAYVKRYMHIKDQDVLNAIAHHVEGTCNHPIAQVLYIADKCEPTRNYDASAFIEMAKSNLTQAFNQVRKNQAIYVEKENKPLG